MTKLGLCEGRHEIAGVEGYVFPADFFADVGEMFDFPRMTRRIKEVFETYGLKPGADFSVELYVTGFTPALVEVLNFCTSNQIGVVLRHFNRDTGGYELQYTATNCWFPELHDDGRI